MGPLVPQVPGGRQDLLVPQVLVGIEVQLGHLGNVVKEVPLVLLDHQERLVPLVQLEKQDPGVNREREDPLDSLVRKAYGRHTRICD